MWWALRKDNFEKRKIKQNWLLPWRVEKQGEAANPKARDPQQWAASMSGRKYVWQDSKCKNILRTRTLSFSLLLRLPFVVVVVVGGDGVAAVVYLFWSAVCWLASSPRLLLSLFLLLWRCCFLWWRCLLFIAHGCCSLVSLFPSLNIFSHAYSFRCCLEFDVCCWIFATR